MTSEVRIRSSTDADAERIHRFLVRDLGWDGELRQIEHLLSHPWGGVDKPHALVVCADEEIVGFIATIFSRWPRAVTAGNESTSPPTLGSFSFYHVRNDHRARSLSLLKRALSLSEMWTSLSPNAYSQLILTRCGFRRFSGGFRLIAPSLRQIWSRRVSVTHVSERDGVAGHWASLIAEHARYGCRSYIVRRDAEETLVVTKKRIAGSRIRGEISEILYVSRPDLLSSVWAALSRSIAVCERVPLIALDDACNPNSGVDSGWYRERVRMSRGFDDHTTPDALYSELVLLY